MSAIYLTQYAPPRVRTWLKPILEILAGVPTVVYGYFAALTVAPVVRDFGLAIGITSASSESALAAGLGHGHHDHPVRQLDGRRFDRRGAAGDARRQPGAGRDRLRRRSARCCFRPRFPGVIGGILLAVSRAIGETMIVVMAAGLAANLTLNPFAQRDHGHHADRPAADRRPGIRQRQDARRLRARPGAVPRSRLLLNLIALRIVRRYPGAI